MRLIFHNSSSTMKIKMASQKQFLKFILTFLILEICLISQTESSDKVKLSVYYEALCPFCASFIVNELVKIFNTDLINIVDLRLVPWGNTLISSDNSWICQHGIDECKLDVAEACAISTWPKVDTHFKFVHCVERLHLLEKHSEWHSCFDATGLDSKQVISCYNNGSGYELEKRYAIETTSLNPHHRFVPWVTVNDSPLQEDYQNFIAYICKAYKGQNIPNACKSNSLRIVPTKETTSRPQVCSLGD